MTVVHAVAPQFLADLLVVLAILVDYESDIRWRPLNRSGELAQSQVLSRTMPEIPFLLRGFDLA